MRLLRSVARILAIAVLVAAPAAAARKPAAPAGATVKLSARAADARNPVGLTAASFEPREYVTVWQSRVGRQALLAVARADAAGGVAITIRTADDTDPAGTRKVCAQGERSLRVACATYRLTDG